MSDPNQLYYGEVIFFWPKKGYGFLSWEADGVKQKDMFVHFSDLSMEGFKTLYTGQKVSFNVGVNLRGVPKAINVKILA
jgi:CspA family cold shock protein